MGLKAQMACEFEFFMFNETADTVREKYYKDMIIIIVFYRIFLQSYINNFLRRHIIYKFFIMKNSYLLTGGSRSGKSRYALELAKSAEKPFYIATAGIGDDEMKDRVAKHQAERGEHWTTIEEQIDLAYLVLHL